MIVKKDLMLYIHIPFCISKCRYCDFLSFPQNDETKYKYVMALLEEIRTEAIKYSECKVSSIFIGGGTPSCIKPEYIVMIMDEIHRAFSVNEDAECTIECNPGTVGPRSFELYKTCGLNRISFGLQSTDDNMLKKLGRIHTFEDFKRGYEDAVSAGFTNINIDVMLGLPGQSMKDAVCDITSVCSMDANHISAYSLIIEEGTPFFDIYHSGKDVSRDMRLPDEELEREIYYRCREILSQYGYEQYEISNYARPGYKCKHNEGYWLRRDYIGFGLGAASLFDNRRWSNTINIDKYIELKNIKEDIEFLSASQQMEETMFLGLRLVNGVDKASFREKYGKDVIDVEEYVVHTQKMVEQGLLEDTGNALKLTNKGLDMANYVMAGYIID